ncbi:MAG: hypothetical protein ABIE94_00195 [archaeon]
MATKTKQVKAKVKKKRWFPIVAPKIFEDSVLGESYVSDYAHLKGKYMTANLMNVTGDARNQHVNIQFQVTKTQDGKGYAEIVKYTMLPTSLKRLVRRGKDKIVDSFTCVTSDKVLVRVKPLFITASISKKSAQTGIRLLARKTLKEIIATNTFDNIMKEIIYNKVQKHLRIILSKVYPLKNCDIRVFMKETEKQTLTVKKKGKEAEEKPEEEKKEEAVEEVKEEKTEEEPAEEKKEKKAEKKAEKKEKKKDITEEVKEEAAEEVKEEVKEEKTEEEKKEEKPKKGKPKKEKKTGAKEEKEKKETEKVPETAPSAEKEDISEEKK